MIQISKAGVFILWGLKQVGKDYRLGAEITLRQEKFNTLQAFAEQSAWDCSEYVQGGLWAAGVDRLTDGTGGVTFVRDFDGAARQYAAARPITMLEGIRLPGALLFIKSPEQYSDKPNNIGHVGISLGNGYVMEARGKASGVTIGPVRPSFNLAAKVAELYVPAVLT